jgi:hypothetical protein
MGRNARALPVRPEAPAVIRADQLLAVDAADRKARAAMRTTIVGGMHRAVAGAPDHDLAAQQLYGKGSSSRQ